MDPVYATVDDFWQLVAPPDTLFQDQGIEPGTWSNVSKVGTGTGSMDVSLLSNPRSTFSVIVTCVSSGEINVYGTINPGPPPRFTISLDNGISATHPLEVEQDGSLAYQKGGFTVLFQNGSTPTSFLASDRFSFTTTPSPDIQAHLIAASREMDPFLKNTICLPLKTWDQNITMICCQLTLWSLLKRRGLDKKQDVEVYYPKRAYEMLKYISISDVQPGVKENGDVFVFSDFGQTRKPYKTDWRF